MIGTSTRRLQLLVALVLALTVTFPAVARGNRDKAAEQPAASTTPIVASDAAARVNGRPVSKQELDQLVESNIQRFAMQGNVLSPEQESMLRTQVLDGLILREVLEQEAARLTVTVSAAEMQETLGQFKAQFPNQQAFEAALAEQGYTTARFESELRRQMVIERLIEREAFKSLVVGPAETRAFYDQNPEIFEQPELVTASHILFSTQQATNDAQRADKRRTAEDVRRRIQGGADFAAMAREFGEDPSAQQGGSLGTFARGQMVEAFEAAAFSLPVGQVSQIVETQFGYHLILVTEKTPPQKQSYAEVADQIESYLLEEQRNAAAQRYVMELRDKATVEKLIQ